MKPKSHLLTYFQSSFSFSFHFKSVSNFLKVKCIFQNLKLISLIHLLSIIIISHHISSQLFISNLSIHINFHLVSPLPSTMKISSSDKGNKVAFSTSPITPYPKKPRTKMHASKETPVAHIARKKAFARSQTQHLFAIRLTISYPKRV